MQLDRQSCRCAVLLVLLAAMAGGGCSTHAASTAAVPTAASEVGRFVWQDLVTPDPPGCRRFYAGLLGWEFRETTRNGRPYLSFAVQGGDSQDQNLLQFFLNVVEFGMDVQQATEAANINSYQMHSSFGSHRAESGP